MKTPILALILALLVVVSGAQIVILINARKSTEEAVERRARPLEERIEVVEGSLSRILARLEGMEAALEEKGRAPAGEEATARGGASTSGPDAEPAESVKKDENLLALLGEERAQELRGLVSEVVKEEREQRHAQDRETALAARKDFEELSQGPYGQWNHRINSLARKLNLTEAQKQRYHELLLEYTRRWKELREGQDRSDPEARKAYREKRGQLQDEFNGSVVVSFNPQQAEAYNELPPMEKTLSESPPLVEIITEGGDVMTGDPAAIFEEGVSEVRFRGVEEEGPASVPLPPPAEGEAQDVPGGSPGR